MESRDITESLRDQVRTALANRSPLRIEGHGSKRFYGRPQPSGIDRLFASAHRGVIDYAPEELVIRVRAGTPLSEVKRLLGENNQQLAFEPPDFASNSTMGGVIASGLSGPRRPWAGSVRDFVLGVTLITGKGEVLEFGGQVMKNVAGYDISRLLTGSMGTLGVILDVSLKVLPAPELEITRALSVMRREFQSQLQSLQGSIPISAAAHQDGLLIIRLSGSEVAVNAAARKIGGEAADNGIWEHLNTLEGFSAVKNLWRVSVAPASDLFLEDAAVVDWGGGVRWLAAPGFNPRDALANEDGHASLVKYDDLPPDMDVFQPLSGPLQAIHSRLKNRFDPAGIFNPGRMYRDI
jgi:glycolate oxidase FAD binding subunit